MYHKKAVKGIGLQGNGNLAQNWGKPESVQLAINAFVEIVQIPDERRNGPHWFQQFQTLLEENFSIFLIPK